MDIQSFAIKQLPDGVQVTLPGLLAVGRVCSPSGEVIADFSADVDGVVIANVLASMSPGELIALVRDNGLAEELLIRKALTQ